MNCSLRFLIVSSFLLCTLYATGLCGKSSTVIGYRAPPGLKTSPLYSVRVNGEEVWTEKFRTNMDTAKMPDWFLESYTRVPQEVHQASFSCDGPMHVSIRVSQPIKHVTIHPVSRTIDHAIEGNVLSLSLDGPRQLYVEIDSLPPLFLFANPPESERVSPKARGVRYFGPGAHRPGYITLKDSESVYIAAGAIVYGGIRAKGAHHIRVAGRGILDGGATFEQMVLVENCADVVFDGVMIRNGAGWTNTLVNCDRITYNNVKVLSFGPACDGIDPLGSRDVTITDCFLRCTDDCIAIKAPAAEHNVNNVRVSGCTMIGFAFSDGITIGFETNAASISNVTVRNCDVILARGGSRVEGHSGFSIVCDGPAVINHVLYDNIRVERAELKLFELNITDGTKYGTGSPGHIKDITLKNISWAHTGPIVLKGLDENHRVERVTFENCTVAGQPLEDVKGTVIRSLGFVDDVRILSRPTSGLQIVEQAGSVKPLDEVTIISEPAGTLIVKDGKGRTYVRMPSAASVTIRAGGSAGTHTVSFVDKNGDTTGRGSFQVESRTDIADGGKFGELFTMLRDGMMADSPRGYEEITWNGRVYRYFVNWGLDNNNTAKGMQYFSPYGGDLVDIMRQTQKSDGMIWSNVNKGEGDYHYYETAYTPLGYFLHDKDAWFVRQPVENHVEYNYVNMMYAYWKSSGDAGWMKRNLEGAARALDYSVTDPVRWSSRFRLLKRAYTIDSWDFQVDDEYTPPAPLSPTMVLVPGKTKFGIFFGDNTGYFEACNQLAEMLDSAGHSPLAASYRERGRGILERLKALSWNGRFFTHFIDEDPDVKRNLGVDEKSQIAQGNMYSLNRGLPHAMNAAIIDTYIELRKHLPPGSPGEWYSIYPPFEKGFANHDQKWQYMNGGIAGHAMGELARGAYENGYERYASEVMERMLELGRKYGHRLLFAYTGSIPQAPPAPAFKPVDISAEANMDLWDKGGTSVFTWMDAGKSSGNDMRGLPTGDQVFQGIRFTVINPEKNQRRAVIAVSTTQGFPRQAEVPVHDTASAVYLLHSSSDNIPSRVAGAITFVYSDGTEASQYLFKGEEVTNWWFSSLNNEKAGVAWWGPNPRSTKVGVCWAAINNPQPHKEIAKLVFRPPLEGGIYAVIGVTLADRPHYVPPKGESFGGPDNWASATGMAALVEGLAGVRNEGLGYSVAALAPRWTSAGTDSAHVTVTLPASNGYVAYRYVHSEGGKNIRMIVTGSGNLIRGHVLLPQGASTADRVTVDDKAAEFKTVRIESSVYVDFTLSLPGVHEVMITYN